MEKGEGKSNFCVDDESRTKIKMSRIIVFFKNQKQIFRVGIFLCFMMFWYKKSKIRSVLVVKRWLEFCAIFLGSCIVSAVVEQRIG